jgi:hypothetical protein
MLGYDGLIPRRICYCPERAYAPGDAWLLWVIVGEYSVATELIRNQGIEKDDGASPSQTLPPGGGIGKPGFPMPLREGQALLRAGAGGNPVPPCSR